MCGIAGVWYLDRRPFGSEGGREFGVELDAVTDSLAHRGPDGRGTYIDNEVSVGLGHRRLSILDLSDDAKQPLSYADGRYWITYNGEIYNFSELRRTLENHGYKFRTQSDTEVVMAAYDYWKEDCLFQFNGMWAFAIWDRVTRTLFLSRDRFGVKPLHYYFDGKRFAFASEMKAFRAFKWFEGRFRPDVVAKAIVQDTSLDAGEDCLVRGIKRLRPGHSLTIDNSGNLREHRWWNTLDHLPVVPKKFSDQVEAFKELFFDACRIRMRSDVPIATALSGGVDSSSVLCTLAALKGQSSNDKRVASDWQNAFIATYPGTVQDEKEYADQIIRHTGVKAHYCPIDVRKALDGIADIVFQVEDFWELLLGPWTVYRHMSELGYRVSLDGHGGDELLAGYAHYPLVAMPVALEQNFNVGEVLRLRRLFHEMHTRQVDTTQIPGVKALIKKDLLSKLSGKRARLNFAQVVHSTTPWLRPEVRTISLGYEQIAEDLTQVPSFDDVGRALYADFHYLLLPAILRNFDRCSMAHGVEVRAPLLDWRIVTFGFALPTTSKISNGYTKRVLRESMLGVLPDSIRLRKSKVGFASPMSDWMKQGLSEFYFDTMNSRHFLESEIWDGPRILKEAKDRKDAGDFGFGQSFWPYVQAATFMNRFTSAAPGKQPVFELR